MQTQPLFAALQARSQNDNAPGSTARRGEQRTAVRYPLEIPVVFRWIEHGQTRESRGWTRDVSVRGAFVHSGDCPPFGARVAVTMNFPASLRRPAGWADAMGMVLRVESRSSSCNGGFAIESSGGRLFTR